MNDELGITNDELLVGDWKKTRIGEFLFEREGKYKPNSDAIAGLKRIEKIDFSGNFYIAQKPSKTNMILICPGDLVISGINVAKGAMGIYRGNENVTATIHYSSYTFDQTKIDVDYFKRFLKSDLFISLLQGQVKGGIKTEIKPKHILPLEIDLPDIKEQRKIVAHFKSIETEDIELKTELTHQQTLLKKLRQQILQEAIEGKLTEEFRIRNDELREEQLQILNDELRKTTDAEAIRNLKLKIRNCRSETAVELLQRIQAEKAQLIKDKKIRKQKPLPPISEDEKSFDLPEGWVWCRLGEVSDVKVGATPSRHNPEYWGGAISWVSSGEVANNYILSTREKITKNAMMESSAKVNPKGSVLVAMIGQGKTRGQTSILKIDAATNQNVAAIRLPDNILSEIVWFFFLSRYETTRSGASGGNQPALNGIKIKNTIFALPPLPEQKAIVAKVEKLLALCDQLESQITHNQNHANALMQAVLKEAFTANNDQSNDQTEQVTAHA